MNTTLLYYLVVIFGVLLFVLTIVSYYNTKKQIDSGRRTSRAERIAAKVDRIQETINLWNYYFVAGKPKNKLRNILITALIFFAVYSLNTAYLRMPNPYFIPLAIFLFIMIVWKIGQRRNRKMFENTFPEILQVINSATSAGGGLLQALERCGKDVGGPLGEEFSLIYRRLAIGEDPATVFDDSYRRYPFKEFYFFIITIRMNLSRGGQIREVIARLGRVVTDSRKMEQKKRAMTSEARMSAMIVACFPIGFFIFMKFTMPENFDFLINDPSGRYILYYVFGSVGLGMGIIWWLMRKAT